MQTFLVYPDYYEALRCLDPKRLGNQIYREGKTLFCGGWKNHPAAKMWKPYRYQLALYCLSGLAVLKYERGKDYPHHFEFFENALANLEDTGPPSWLGDDRLHASHRSNLLRKAPEYYSQFGWVEGPDIPYYWPV